MSVSRKGRQRERRERSMSQVAVTVEGSTSGCRIPCSWGLALALLCGVVGYLLGWRGGSTGLVVQERVDTVVQVVERPVIRYRVRPTRVVVVDTVQVPSPAYVACHDTVVRRDTVSVCYAHPERLFSVVIRQAPDSVRLVERVVTVTVPVGQEKRKWWEEAAWLSGSLVVGYVLGRISP